MSLILVLLSSLKNYADLAQKCSLLGHSDERLWRL